jgi:hypothetical protein
VQRCTRRSPMVHAMPFQVGVQLSSVTAGTFMISSLRKPGTNSDLLWNQ